MTKNEREEKLQSLMTFESLSEEAALKIVDKLDELDKMRGAMRKSQIMDYAKKIRPVLRGTSEEVSTHITLKGLPLFWVESRAISTQSCFFDPTIIREAVGLKEVARITSFHKYGGYPLFLRPSADEAIWQCPKDVLDKVCAFETFTETMDINCVYDRGLDMHVMTTVYYEGELPEDIAAPEIKW